MSDDVVIAQLQARIQELETELEACAASNAVLIEISKREAMLAEAERVAGMGSWSWNPVSRTVRWSAGCYRILGYDPDETEPSVEAFYARVHPKDIERIRRGESELASTGMAALGRTRICRPDGTERVVLLNASGFLDNQGVARRVVGTLTDITEAQRLEDSLSQRANELELAQQIANVASWTWYPGNSTAEWSPQMYAILGLDMNTATPSGETFRNALHPEDHEAYDTYVSATPTGREHKSEWRILWPDGTVRFVETLARPLFDEDGNIERIVGMVFDITERKLLENQLVHARKMQAVGTLAGGIAHDFNNLLLVIRGNAELMAMTLDTNNPEAVHLFEVLDAVERAEVVTHRLLSFTRRSPAGLEVIDTQRFLEKTSQILRQLIEGHITIESSWDPDLLPIRAEPAQLEQVIFNLALNARDAMIQGGTLALSAENIELDPPFCARVPALSPGHYIHIRVRDTGQGIPPHLLSRIFEPFYTTKDPEHGTGLGLTTAYATLQNLGGALLVDSKPGGGSTFDAYVPAVRGLTPSMEIPSLDLSLPRGSERILVVEDRERVRAVTRAQLEFAGYDVVCASNGHDALDLLASQHVDLLLTDVVMPRMTGTELARIVRERFPALPIVFITGHPGHASLEDATVIAKPFLLRTLLKTLRATLDG